MGALGVFGLGMSLTAAVARLTPALSLLVALLTYSLQVVIIGLVYYGLSSSGTLGCSAIMHSGKKSVMR